jgi:PLP dependent protein
MRRRSELASNLAEVRARIARSCAKAGRPDSTVTLIVITKYFPASDVRLLAELGVTDVGENRHPEAFDKRAECTDLNLRWHYVGGMQSNKAAVIGSYVDVVHSIDRTKLVAALDRGAGQAERAAGLDCFVQVSLDPPSHRGSRSGVPSSQLLEVAQAVQDANHLHLMGLMAVAPLAEEPVVSFARLAKVRGQFLEEFPEASGLSAGMSGDFEAAIAAGATHVRVGRSVLGLRPTFQ